MLKYILPFLLVIFAGCSSSEKTIIIDEQNIAGTYTRTSLRQNNQDDESNLFKIDLKLILKENGEFEASEDNRNFKGNYLLDGNKLIVLNKSCTGKGVYKIELKFGKLILTEIEDDCLFRDMILDGAWIKEENKSTSEKPSS